MTTAPSDKSILKLRLPASSANLGPGFDAAGLAMSLYLEMEAKHAAAFSIQATGRNAELCSALENNLILDTYREVLSRNNSGITPLSITMQNGIPLGMGCGSSAAGIIAGVALAAHFGNLSWSREDILNEACRIEGHPDNVAACWLGGLTVSAMVDGKCIASSLSAPAEWSLLLALPKNPFSTKKARALLPEQYSRADAVFNVQRMALLTAAFANHDGKLLAEAMQDRIHQPYRSPMCPLMSALQPLAGSNGILGVALSGAGPSVLLVIDAAQSLNEIVQRVRTAAATTGETDLQIVPCKPENQPASMR